MKTPANQPPGLTPGLREFLAEPARDEAWHRPAGTAYLAESDFGVEEQLLGDSSTRSVPEGGLKLNRVTYRPLSPDDVPALADYRAGLADARFVLAMFWFMLTELPARRSYDTVRIMVKLQPPAPVLLLSPDGPDGSGPAWRALGAEIAAALESLLPTGSQLAATALDHGDDGFGWKYEARDDAPLIPQRITTLVVLELPPVVTGLDGVLDADAQINRSVLGKAFSRPATLVNPAVPFHVPFAADAFAANGAEPRIQPPGPGRPQRTSAAGQRGRPRAHSSPPDRYDLGMIVALREEFDCAREVFSFERQVTENGSYLYPFTVPGSSRRGVAVVLYGMGSTMTGVQAANLLDWFEIPVLALMGIAGALDGDLRLGDVVVASVVDPYLDRAKARRGRSGAGFDLDSGAARGGPGATW
jgi:Phosphorylase superfamily